MTDKVTLTDLANLQNETTAVTAINNNNAAITTAMDNTLSRDGTSPNAMGANLDMNSFQIINLPSPSTNTSALRFQDLADFLEGDLTIDSLPAGGSTNAVLHKLSGTDGDAGWTLTPTVTSVTTTGAATVGTTLDVTGAATFASTIDNSLGIKCSGNNSDSSNGQTWLGSFRKNQAGVSQVGIFNSNTTSSGVTQLQLVSGTASSFAKLRLQESGSSSSTLNLDMGSAVTGGLTISTQGVSVGTPTGGNKGVGTVNATGLYINGTAIGGTGLTPTVQRFTSGSGTYTAPANVKNLRVRMVAGGGGGGAGITNNGSNGGDTSFGSWTAIHGQGGTHGTSGSAAGGGGTGGTGGATGTGTLINRVSGSDGNGGSLGNTGVTIAGPSGGVSFFGGAGQGNANATGGAAQANSGSGGAGGSILQDCTGGGGGAGEYVEFWVTSPANVSYAVGASGAGGAAGSKAGGAGAAGIIIVEEFYI